MPRRSKHHLSKRRTYISPQPRSSASEFKPDYTHVRSDLKRIGIIAGSFFAILVALSFILPILMR
jgi:hypothetical protein